MITQAGQAITPSAFFTGSKLGVAGLTVTVDIYRVLLADLTVLQVVTGGAATAVGGGLYTYRHVTTAAMPAYYYAIFKTATTTVDLQHIASLHIVGIPVAENIDATISSRLAAGSYTAPDNATIAAISGYVDTEVAAIKAKTDLIPPSPAAVGSAMTLEAAERTTLVAAVWAALTAGLTTVGSVGKLLVDNVNATISSRSTLTSTAVWSEDLLGDSVTAGEHLTGTYGNIVVLLNRIGAFAGTATNSVRGFLLAMMSKSAVLPTEVGGTYSVLTDSLEAQAEAAAAASGGTQTITGPIGLYVEGATDDTRVEMFKGDTAPALIARLLDADGDPVNITGYTIAVFISDGVTAATVAATGTPTVVLGTDGRIQYAWAAADTATVGAYYLSVRATLGASVISAGTIKLIVRDRL